MKKSIRYAHKLMPAFIFSILLFHPLNPCEACENVRAISLRALQNELRVCQSKGACSQELLRLANINMIMGYLVDNNNNDLVILGKVDPALPPIDLENFVLALRSAWHNYESYENPVCSIDPDPSIVQQLQRIGNYVLSSRTPEQAEERLKEWHRICKSPQTVRVLGIPFHTRFAQIMVKADYDMKKIVDGSDPLAIPNLTSLVEMTLDKVRKDFSPNRPVPIPLSMNRFWFYPGTNRYDENEGIVLINECPVTLLTEEAHVAAGRMFFGTGGYNPQAKAFAENFTAHYKEIAERRPIYTQLENLFRLVALAKIIKYKSSDEEAELDLTYLLQSYPIANTAVDIQLPGHSNVERLHLQGSYWEAYLWLPTCGGVDVNIRIKPESFDRRTRKDLSAFRSAILNAKPSPNAIYWDYVLPINTYIAEFGENKFLKRANEINRNCHLIAIKDELTGFTAYNGEEKANGEKKALYEGDDKQAFLDAIVKTLGTNKNKTIYLYWDGLYIESEADAFKSALQFKQKITKTNFALNILPGIYQLQDYFISEVQSVEAGPVKNIGNRWTATLEFFLRQGGKLIKIVVQVFANTADIIWELINNIKNRLSSQTHQTETLEDVINEEMMRLRDKYNSTEEEFYKEIIKIDCAILYDELKDTDLLCKMQIYQTELSNQKTVYSSLEFLPVKRSS